METGRLDVDSGGTVPATVNPGDAAIERMGPLAVRFWGVRGSVPAPGPATAKYGGNTSCVEVEAGAERIVFDMGTGFRCLGNALAGKPVNATIFLSHYHWDHIQGLPFFGPAFDPRSRLTVYGANRQGQGVGEILHGQMLAPYFPVGMDALRAKLDYRAIASGEQVSVGEVRVSARELSHPNGVLGYRVELGGKSIVYATDTEHGPESDAALCELAEGADCLIYDTMYTTAEYQAGVPSKKGWGHSTWEAGVAIVRQVGVRKLVLFHHEPRRSDEELEAMLADARRTWPDTVAAREGETLVF